MDASDRLRAVRKEKYRTAADAAKALGVKYPTYAGHENGSRGILVDEAVKYAKHFKVRLDWLLQGIGPARPGQVDPVMAEYESLPPHRREEALRYIRFLRSQEGAE